MKHIPSISTLDEKTKTEHHLSLLNIFGIIYLGAGLGSLTVGVVGDWIFYGVSWFAFGFVLIIYDLAFKD